MLRNWSARLLNELKCRQRECLTALREVRDLLRACSGPVSILAHAEVGLALSGCELGAGGSDGGVVRGDWMGDGQVESHEEHGDHDGEQVHSCRRVV